MLNGKIKFLQPEIIKLEADKILAQAQKLQLYNANEETPIEKIAENLLKLRLIFHDLEKERSGVLGAMDMKNKIIWLDYALDNTQTGQFIDEARCNFTIAHEIGHYILHGDIMLSDGLVAFHDELDPNTKNAETQANMFAAMLLMPRDLMLKKWHRDFANIVDYADLIFAMTQFFRVSREAMQNRLKVLGLLREEEFF